MEAHSSLRKYLGSSIDIQGSKVQHFTPLLDTISNKISLWNHCTLSQSTKLIIINTILVATIMKQSSIFSVQATIVHKLDAMIAQFFSRNHTKKGIHWKKKEVMHQPRGQGGLGFHNIGCFNKALLMKKVWRTYHHPQLLLSKVFHSTNQSSSWVRLTTHNLSLGRKGLLMASQTL